MDMNMNQLLIGLVFSSIGLGYFIYGRKRENIVTRYTGVALMIYPYFVDSTMLLVCIGLALLFIPKFIRF